MTEKEKKLYIIYMELKGPELDVLCFSFIFIFVSFLFKYSRLVNEYFQKRLVNEPVHEHCV